MEAILIILVLVSLGFNFLIYGKIKEIQPKKKKKKKSDPKIKASAKNSLAVNSTVDQQNIKTAGIEIPVIAEDVLTYEAGELGAAYPEKTRLFYSEEAINDPDYLETVKRSPLQVQTHQKNTSEFNRDVDGWPVDVWYDKSAKRVMAKGVLHGEKNVKYAEENKHLPGFGTSAFISFLKIDRTPGMAPNGKPYDAVVRKAVNNHIAILPGIRDKNNVIVAMNAVEGETTNTTEKSVDNSELESPAQDRAQNTSEAKKLDYNEFKGHMNTYNEEKAAEDKKAEELKNSIKNELKEESGKAAETSSAKSAGNAPESSGKTAENAEKKTETATASNALPSEEMVKDFSTHLGISFAKTPSLVELGSLVGVSAENSAELISALNSKREEFKTKKPTAAASNSEASLSDVMAGM